MNAFHRSWADDSSEITWPIDRLALAAARAQNDDDVFPVDLFVDERWDDEEIAVPAFYVLGGPPSVTRMTRGLGKVTQARGIVKHIEEDRIVLGTPGICTSEVSVGYHLPASVDVRPLIGRRVRVTLEEEPLPKLRTEQTLTIRAAATDHLWLAARHDADGEATHAIGGKLVRVTCSPNAGGPLVVDAGDVHRIVPPRGEARLVLEGARYVVELAPRDGAGGVSYFIADERLWH